MQNRMTPYHWFSTFLDGLSTIINRHAIVDKDNADIGKMNQLIKQCKHKLNEQMDWEGMSKVEDEIYPILLKMLPDYLDVTGLFNKIQYEIERKKTIIKEVNKDKNINKIIISQQIQDYIDTHTQRMTDIFTYLKHKKQDQNQEGHENSISYISSAYQQRGMDYLKHGKVAKAILDLNQAILLDPMNGTFYHNRATAYTLLESGWIGEWRLQIFQDYTKAIELGPMDIAAYYHRAKFHDSFSKEKKIADFKALVELSPKSAIERSFQALALSELGNFHDSIDEHHKAILLGPHASILYLNRAITYQKCQFILMIDILIDCWMAYHIDPNDFVIQSGINDLFKLLFEYRNPEIVFKEIVKIKNEKLQIILLSDALNKKTPFGQWFDRKLSFPDKFFLFPDGLLNQMKNYYNKLIINHRDLKDAIVNDSEQIKSIISQFYLDKENNKKIKSANDKALDHLRRGNTLFNRKNYWKYSSADYQAAIEAYTRAIKLNPKYAEAYYNRGIVYQELSPLTNHVLACMDFTKVIELAPNHASAYYRLGYSLARLCIKQGPQHFKEAINAYNKAIALKPTFTEVYLARASLYEKFAKKDPMARKSLMAKVIVDCMEAFHLGPNNSHNQNIIIGLLTYRLKQIKEEDKENIPDVIKEISGHPLQIQALNFLLFENALWHTSLKSTLFTSDDISKMKTFRNQLIVDRNNARNAGIVLAQAYRQNIKAKRLLHAGRSIDHSKENNFFPLATETIRHIGFFSSERPSQTFDQYFNIGHPSASTWPTHQNEMPDQPGPITLKRK